MEPETQKDGGLYWSDMEALMGLSAEDTLLEFPFKQTVGLLSLSLSLSLSHILTHTRAHPHSHWLSSTFYPLILALTGNS